ncbi:TPA: secretion protein EspS [Escherichia coli]|nr:secretion protein EspS [Escherichia coli]HAY0341039.1 secretion protein EspS [Escherichia coli]HEL8012582.1 secretion protein EspS [Escherichia coli]HEM0101849.1 secretion protein EspS [Escherichia coli]HEM0848971.1 secretion protein EspS [Escherichia coli]
MFSIRSLLPISASVSVPAKQSQSIPTTLAGRTIEKAQEKEGLLVFLGMKSVNEYTLNILGQNVSRVTTGKKPYDLLFLNDATKQDFDKRKMEFTYPGANKTHLQSSNSDVVAAAAISIAATEMKTILPNDLTPRKYNKIYLSGDGSAGLPILKCGDEFLSPADIVDRITQHNLHEINDIRLTSCHSANITKNNDFSPDEIEKSANLNNGWLARVLFGQKKSLAEHVCAEFASRGMDVSISGYYGAGVFYVPEHGKPTTHLRSTTVPATPEYTVRRSDYRATFGRIPPIDIG